MTSIAVFTGLCRCGKVYFFPAATGDQSLLQVRMLTGTRLLFAVSQ